MYAANQNPPFRPQPIRGMYYPRSQRLPPPQPPRFHSTPWHGGGIIRMPGDLGPPPPPPALSGGHYMQRGGGIVRNYMRPPPPVYASAPPPLPTARGRGRCHTFPAGRAGRFQSNQRVRGKSFRRVDQRPRRTKNSALGKSKMRRNPRTNPTDPLNLKDLIAEEMRRKRLGQSPLPGDSTFNTPAVSMAGDLETMSEPGGSQLQVNPASFESTQQQRRQATANRRGGRRAGLTRGDYSRGYPASRHLHTIRDGRVTKPGEHFSSFSQAAIANYSRQGGRGRANRYQSSSRGGRHRSAPTGNYVDYYQRRDPRARLHVLIKDWFASKDVADYGCHNGTFTFMLLEKFPEIRRLDAFDCDAELITSAKHNQREKIRLETSRQMLENLENPVFDYGKINFQLANWAQRVAGEEGPDGTGPLADTEASEYDAILAFSVTKWIHLNHGDAGLRRFLRRVFNRLKPGGHLIIEPQPRKSYKRSIQLPIHRLNFQSMQINPSDLQPVLVDIGFTYFDTIHIPMRLEPFGRRIILCTKSCGLTPVPVRNSAIIAAHQWDDEQGEELGRHNNTGSTLDDEDMAGPEVVSRLSNTVMQVPPPLFYEPRSPFDPFAGGQIQLQISSPPRTMVVTRTTADSTITPHSTSQEESANPNPLPLSPRLDAITPMITAVEEGLMSGSPMQMRPPTPPDSPTTTTQVVP